MVLFCLFVCYSLLFTFHVLLPYFLSKRELQKLERCLWKTDGNQPSSSFNIPWHYTKFVLLGVFSYIHFLIETIAWKLGQIKPLPKINKLLQKLRPLLVTSVAQKHLCLSSLMWKVLLKKKEKLIMIMMMIIIIIITITKLSNLIGYQLPWFQP